MTLFTPPQILDSHRWRGMRVGVLGGSFNPPHRGHLHISDVAIKALQLDCVWWLVTPQNPLKDKSDTLPFEKRMALCQTLIADHPRLIISDLENRFGSVARTADTVRFLQMMFTATELVFLGGTDLLAQLPRWYRWRDIPAAIAMGIIARPPAPSLVRANPLFALPGQNHFIGSGSRKLPLLPKNRFWITAGQLDRTSSTDIRKSI